MGAASVAAKVTRDACVEGWIFEETYEESKIHSGTQDEEATQVNSGPAKEGMSEKTLDLEQQSNSRWSSEMGSGYPSGMHIPPFLLIKVF